MGSLLSSVFKTCFCYSPLYTHPISLLFFILFLDRQYIFSFFLNFFCVSLASCAFSCLHLVGFCGVCVCLCVCMCAYTCVHGCMHGCGHVCVYLTCTCVCMSCVQMHLCACEDDCVHKLVCTYADACVFIWVCTWAVHIYVCVCAWVEHVCVLAPACGNWRITYNVIAQEPSLLRLSLSLAWKLPDRRGVWPVSTEWSS